MCNWHDWLSPWQWECWPWQVPREQLVGSGRLVSKQIYSQSSTACPLNRGRNDKEAIRVKENKGGIVQLSESTDGEEEKPFLYSICQLAGGDQWEWGAWRQKESDQIDAPAFWGKEYKAASCCDSVLWGRNAFQLTIWSYYSISLVCWIYDSMNARAWFGVLYWIYWCEHRTHLLTQIISLHWNWSVSLIGGHCPLFAILISVITSVRNM